MVLYLHPQSASTTAQNCKGTLAQMVEQWTENPCVPGSIPGGTTNIGINPKTCGLVKIRHKY